MVQGGKFRGEGGPGRVAREVREVGGKASEEEARARELWSTNNTSICRRFCSTILLSSRFPNFLLQGHSRRKGRPLPPRRTSSSSSTASPTVNFIPHNFIY